MNNTSLINIYNIQNNAALLDEDALQCLQREGKRDERNYQEPRTGNGDVATTPKPNQYDEGELGLTEPGTAMSYNAQLESVKPVTLNALMEGPNLQHLQDDNKRLFSTFSKARN